ncbi:hypothetical protein PSTG_08369 [Puccinia striiformis f. sp. tritici PST-78]|uniref:Uncharacterized protein n=1 Tax=Puccinia striiformis f. sp. tritici PST-78 TaxID=1165861 RepID=A0A0L0VG65_9BASI|nr:hypothetical protein PSTG_08369 [Puccinia striiformis f. sp. tritici PST-78]
MDLDIPNEIWQSKPEHSYPQRLPDASLYKSKWAATKTKKLKFTLIHNVWTTKGNRYTSIGASVAYIDDNWDFNMSHLSIKGESAALR